MVDIIKQICEQMNLSVAELVRCVDQTPQNVNDELKHGNVTFHELKTITYALDIEFD